MRITHFTPARQVSMCPSWVTIIIIIIDEQLKSTCTDQISCIIAVPDKTEDHWLRVSLRQEAQASAGREMDWRRAREQEVEPNSLRLH